MRFVEAAKLPGFARIRVRFTRILPQSKDSRTTEISHPATIQGLTNYGNIPSCHTYQTPEQRKYPIREKRANEKTNTTTGHPK